ncbi:MAG: PAS domain S-box protein [Bacteroidales bacterium]
MKLNSHVLRTILISLVLVVVLVVSSILIYSHRVVVQKSHFENDVMTQAHMLAQSFISQEIGKFVRNDPGHYHAYFQQMDEVLNSYRDFAGMRNIFTFFQTDDGKIKPGPSSVSGILSISDLPAHFRDNQLAALDTVFTTGKVISIFPDQMQDDDYLIMIPVMNPRTKEVLMILGVDYNTDSVRAVIVKEKRLLIFLTALSVFAVLISALIIIQRNEISSSPWSVFHYTEIALMTLLGLIFTYYIAATLSEREQNEKLNVFRTMAQLQTNRVIDIFYNLHDKDLESLNSFFKIKDQVNQNDFSAFTEKIYNRSYIAGVGWAPFVLHEDRNAFIEAAQQENNNIKEIYYKGEYGEKRISPIADHYFPLLYTEPFTEINTVSGIDLLGSPVRREAVLRSVKYHIPVITRQIERFSNAEPAFNVYMPVFDKNDTIRSDQSQFDFLKGVLYITLRMDALFGKDSLLENVIGTDIDLSLFELHNNGNKTYLAGESPLEEINRYQQPVDYNINYLSGNDHFRKYFPLVFFGRSFVVEARPSPSFYQSYPGQIFWNSVIVGVIITLMISLTMLLIMKRKISLQKKLSLQSATLSTHQNKMQEVNRHFDKIARQNHMILWKINTDGLITFISDFVEEVIKIKPEEVVHKKFLWELLPGEKLTSLKKIFIETVVSKKEFAHIELQSEIPEKGKRWFSFQGIPIVNENNQINGYQGSVTDITNRKMLQEAENIHKQRAEQQILLDNIPTQVWYFTKPDTYGSVNRAHAIFLGVEPEELVYKNIYQVLPFEKAKILTRGNDKLFRSGKAEQMEILITKGNERRYLSVFKSPRVNATGKVEYVVCSAEDITSEKAAKEKLSLSEQRYKALSENAFDGIFLLSDGRFEYVNDKFCEIAGYTKDQILLGDFRRKHLLTPESNQIAEKRLQMRLEGIDVSSIYEAEIITQSGEIKQVEVSNASLKDNGKLKILGVMRDITERKRAVKLEQEIAVAKQSAVFKQNFLSTMSHEIRTPLTGILGMGELLARTNLDETQKQYIDALRQAGDILKETLNLVLDYSKIEAGKVSLKLKKLESKQIVLNAQNFFQGAVGDKKIKFRSEIQENVPDFIFTDIQKLNQIIHNLVSNAIKFTKEGFISFHMALDKQIPDSNNGNSVYLIKITIKDTGSGIEPELTRKLFTPYYQVEKDNDNPLIKGTGLGLSICKELTGLLGGEIGVESQVNSGSSFWFTFKTQLPDYVLDEKDHKSGNLSSPRRARSLNILLVDDKFVNRQVVALILKSLNHHVIMAENGEQAINVYPLHDFDLILMDIVMPVLDGVTATSILKERYPDLPPVVGLSANALEGDRKKYMEKGMDEYLTKPVSSEDFMQLIQKLKLI